MSVKTKTRTAISVCQLVTRTAVHAAWHTPAGEVVLMGTLAAVLLWELRTAGVSAPWWLALVGLLWPAWLNAVAMVYTALVQRHVAAEQNTPIHGSAHRARRGVR